MPKCTRKRLKRAMLRATNLAIYLDSHKRYPSASDASADSRSLALWVKRTRAASVVGTLSNKVKEKIISVTPGIFDPVGKGKRPLTSWQSVFRQGSPGLLSACSFVDHQNRLYIGPENSVVEYVVKRLDIPEIGPRDCIAASTYGTIQRVLSFIVDSDKVLSVSLERRIPPTWVCRDPFCYSTYFDKASYLNSDNDRRMLSFVKATIIPPALVDALRLARCKDTAAAAINMYSDIFDDFHYGKQGRYWKTLIRINESTLPQPRRITYSVTIGDDYMSDKGETIRDLYLYGASGRPPADWRCRPIPPRVAELGERLWRKVWVHLSPPSRLCPPTGVQVLLYVSTFGSVIRPHKDNGLRKDDGRQTRTSTDKDLNSHIFGTSVIVLSLFDTMDFGLLVPKPGLTYHAGQREHIWSDNTTIPLDDQSIFVLDPKDDENFMHSARFPTGSEPGKIRVALVFRWVSRRCRFYADRKGPRRDALYVPDAKVDLMKTRKGTHWVRALDLNDSSAVI